MELTIEELHNALDYNPETGIFIWKVQSANKIKIGQIAGMLHKLNGHVYIVFKNVKYFAHRLAWFYINHQWPEYYIDHINGIGSDNRISNLRDVPQSVNMENQRKPRKDNKSGFLGVSPKRNKWVAVIHSNGKKKHLGTFTTKESAYEAYLCAKRIYHVGCTL